MTAYPELVSGHGSIETLPDLVEDGRWNRVLLVCGQTSFEMSGASRVLTPLGLHRKVVRWSEFQPNPVAEDLRAGLRILDEVSPDVVVGIGGGTAMDLAKLLCGFDGVTGIDDPESAIRSGEPLGQRRRGLILAPTTSGSGAEATHFSTVYIGSDKFSVTGAALRPDVIILDPELTMSASPYQKATSGVDAVAQAIESLWAVGASAPSRRFARRALRHLLPNIEEYVHDGSGQTAEAMALGSHLAGRAIDISRTTAAHALSYSLTQGHGVSHGHAVALTLGGFIEAHHQPSPSRLQPGVDPETHDMVMTEVAHYLDANSGVDARRNFSELMRRIGLSTSLSAVGVTTAEHRAELAASVNVERLGNNPVVFDVSELGLLLAGLE